MTDQTGVDIGVEALLSRFGPLSAPLIIDVRPAASFAEANSVVAGCLRREPDAESPSEIQRFVITPEIAAEPCVSGTGG